MGLFVLIYYFSKAFHFFFPYNVITLNISSLFEGKLGTVNGTLYAKDEGLPNQKIIINITNTKGYNEKYKKIVDIKF